MHTIKKPEPGQLVVRAYCAKCGKLLMESTPLTKKQLIKLWDKTVIGAVGIKCEDCGLKFPNFDINLKIYNRKLGSEYAPTDYIKIPKSKKQSPEELFKEVSKRWLKEHPGIKEPTQDEVVEALNQQRAEIDNMSMQEKLEKTIELRKKYNAEGRK